MSCYKTLLKRT